MHQGFSHRTAGLTSQHRSVTPQARDVCMHVLDATIQPRRNKGTISERLTMGARSFTYRINGLDHLAPPCAGSRALIAVYSLPRDSRKWQLSITSGNRHTLTCTHTHTHTHRPLRRHTCRILLIGLCPLAGLHPVCVQLSQGAVYQTHRVGADQRAQSLSISGRRLPWTSREWPLSPARSKMCMHVCLHICMCVCLFVCKQRTAKRAADCQ